MSIWHPSMDLDSGCGGCRPAATQHERVLGRCRWSYRPRVRRSEGRKGIASTALGEALAYVGDPVGLIRVLVTCDERNPVSRKAIEACGGLLESVRPADQLSRNVGCSRDTLRYWVRTSVSSVR